MWGVFRFKDGLGAEVMRTVGGWDFPVRPRLYRFYMQALPRVLNLMRRRGRERDCPQRCRHDAANPVGSFAHRQ